MWIAITGLVVPLIGLALFSKYFEWDWREIKFKNYSCCCIPIILLVNTLIWSSGHYFHTSFNECWNFKINSVQYYEDWDEMVSCRHPKYCTRPVTRYTTDSKGRTSSYTTTEIYQCGWLHPYDIDYHAKDWEAIDDTGNSHSIDQPTYQSWKIKWNNEHFVDMHRHFYSKDGDMYQSDWPHQFELIYPYSEIHNYENKVRISRSVFNYPDVDKDTKEKYPRPVDNNDTSPLHGYGVPVYSHDEWTLRLVNAEAGVAHQVHVTMFLFDSNKYSEAETETLKAAWKGPNKNELVICVGVNPADYKVVWCDVFSWMDDTTGHVKVRQFILDSGYLKIQELCQYLRNNINEYWHRKSFKDFSYIKIPIPFGYTLAMIIFAIVTATVAGFVIEKHNG